MKVLIELDMPDGKGLMRDSIIGAVCAGLWKPYHEEQAGEIGITGNVTGLGDPSNVHYLNNVTSIDIPADRVLQKAMGKLTKAVIAGYDIHGDYYFASSVADGGDALWLIENLKMALLTDEAEDA